MRLIPTIVLTARLFTLSQSIVTTCKPLHLKDIIEEFEQTQDAHLYEQRKEDLRSYYISGAYEHDIEIICAQAQEHFSRLAPTPRSLVIFDINDTALSIAPATKEALFIGYQKKPSYFFKPAIKAVYQLYSELLKRGFKIIFLSGRLIGSYHRTVKELADAGYCEFEEVILRPSRDLKIDAWKLACRIELAQHYTILGCIGDRAVDFEGGYTGYRVRLPNYLY